MKTIIIQYDNKEDLAKLIDKTLSIESSSKASLVRRALYFYCNKIIKECNEDGK